MNKETMEKMKLNEEFAELMSKIKILARNKFLLKKFIGDKETDIAESNNKLHIKIRKLEIEQIKKRIYNIDGLLEQASLDEDAIVEQLNKLS